MDDLDRSIGRISEELGRLQDELKRAGLLAGEAPTAVPRSPFAQRFATWYDRVYALFNLHHSHTRHLLAHAPRPD